jgi:protein-tyrosine kinase
LSLIENSLERLRRATLAAKEPVTSAAPVTSPARLESVAALDLRAKHRRIQVDMSRLRSAGYLPEEGHERRFADYCHRIKRPLIDRALSVDGVRDARLMLLTSAVPGDGKTFMTINLALSMARERDASVLLVDGDLPRAQISHVLGVDNEPGLLNALRDDTLDIESLVLDSDIRGLEVLPAGSPADGASELIASARMRDIAAKLISRNSRRLVLFDSPPLLVSSEARALVRVPGQVLLVARAGHTPREAIVEALTHVDKSRLFGLVLNDGHADSGSSYYGYGYGSQDASD